jgi:hypothetical protein
VSDITKCKGGECPFKETCWRYKAPGNDFYQSYFSTVPFETKTYSCGEYWEMIKGVRT